MERDSFTAREVGTMIEGLRSEFKTVLEVVLPLRENMLEVKERLSVVEFEVRSLKDVVKVAIPDLYKRVSRLESKAGF